MTLLTYDIPEAITLSSARPVRDPLKSKKIKTISFWITLVVAVTASGVFGYLKGGQNGLIFTALALLPLTLLITATLLLSSRAEVPLWTRLFALIWGGAGATSGTLLVITIQNKLFGASNSMDSVVVQAAVVEESAKAVFLFALLFFARKFIRTPLRGVMLGFLVGAGFAYIENIIYFASAYQSGGWDVFWATFFARAVKSFFLHSIATMCTGLFIGYAQSKKFGFWKKLIVVDVGLLSAMTIHGMWNGLASLTTDDHKWNLMYAFFWVPLVITLITILILIRKDNTRKRAEVYHRSAQQGFIGFLQADKMATKTTRKIVYKKSDTRKVIIWEQAVLDADYWKQLADSLSEKKRNVKKKARYNTRHSKALQRLAYVKESI
jgi:RsiW-degrading membrane proteinase PrsW (M82 family)